MINGPIQHESIAVLSMYEPNRRAIKVCKARTDRAEKRRDKPTITGGQFRISLCLSLIARTIR